MPPVNARPSEIELITERFINAIMEQRLAPGSKLSEVRLAEAFGVSRTKIRRVFSVMARTGLIRLYPNRGAYIIRLSTAEAREILEARKLLEPLLIRGVIDNANSQNITKLRQHLKQEQDARKERDRRTIIRLSGTFHLLLANMSGNRYLAKSMGELCPLTCLAIALYDLPQTPACPEGEHDLIVDAIEAGDAERAINHMKAHLQHVESALNLDDQPASELDWPQLVE